jgi:hypothetical protein
VWRAREANRRFWLPLGVIVGAGLLIRVVYVLTAVRHDPPFGDAQTYVFLGHNLADGRGYIRPFDFLTTGAEIPTAEFPPLWPSVLAVPQRIGIDSVTALRMLGAVVSVFITALVGYGNPRFRMVAEPGLLCLAAVTIVTGVGAAGAPPRTARGSTRRSDA